MIRKPLLFFLWGNVILLAWTFSVCGAAEELSWRKIEGEQRAALLNEYETTWQSWVKSVVTIHTNYCRAIVSSYRIHPLSPLEMDQIVAEARKMVDVKKTEEVFLFLLNKTVKTPSNPSEKGLAAYAELFSKNEFWQDSNNKKEAHGLLRYGKVSEYILSGKNAIDLRTSNRQVNIFAASDSRIDMPYICDFIQPPNWSLPPQWSSKPENQVELYVCEQNGQTKIAYRPTARDWTEMDIQIDTQSKGLIGFSTFEGEKRFQSVYGLGHSTIPGNITIPKISINVDFDETTGKSSFIKIYGVEDISLNQTLPQETFLAHGEAGYVIRDYRKNLNESMIYQLDQDTNDVVRWVDQQQFSIPESHHTRTWTIVLINLIGVALIVLLIRLRKRAG